MTLERFRARWGYLADELPGYRELLLDVSCIFAYAYTLGRQAGVEAMEKYEP